VDAVSAVEQALRWLNDPLNWTEPGSGVIARTVEHLALSGIAMLLACAVAWPLALWLGHTGRGGGLVVVASNASRAIPTLALLTIFSSAGATLFGNPATVLALAIFAVPPLLSNAYTGLRQVDPEVREAARGMGLSELQLLVRVELPLAVPLIAAGFRTAAVQVVATATLAGLVGGGGLGNVINLGFGLQDQGQILAGGLLVAVLALSTEGVLALVQRAVSPRGIRPRPVRMSRQVEPAPA